MSVRRWQKQMFIEGASYFSSLLDSMSVSEESKRGIERLAGIRNLSGSVLDLGCGPGRFIEFFASRAKLVVGVDISHPFLERASARSARKVVTLVDQDMTRFLSHTELRFNAIFRLYTSLGYFSRDEEAEILQLAHAVSKRNGVMLIDSYNSDLFRARKLYVQIVRTDSLLVHEQYQWEEGPQRTACVWRYLPIRPDFPPELLTLCPPWHEVEQLYQCAPLQEVHFKLDAYNCEEVSRLAKNCGWHVDGIYRDINGTPLEAVEGPPERLVAVLRKR